MIKVPLIIIASLVSLHLSAQQMSAIRGKIINGNDQRPLGGANIFIANSTKGTTSDDNGYFEFPNLPEGGYKLVVSFVGYSTQVVTLRADNKRTYTIVLQPSVIMLDEIVVSSKKENRVEWASNYKIFKDYFIGQSDNSKLCNILNPAVLHFSKRDGILTARADSMLIIENEGLGYRVKFLLEDFKYNLISNKVKYKGQTSFERLPVGDEKTKRSNASNRLKAYYGSQMHFMRSLCKRDLFNEGFFVMVFDEQYDGDPRSGTGVSDTIVKAHVKIFDKNINIPSLRNYNSFLDSTRSTQKETVLSFKGQLEVNYWNEAESYDYQRGRNKRNLGYTLPQRSLLVLLKNGQPVEPNGVLLDEENVVTKGYWSWELVSESLPSDYNPEEDLSLNISEK